jgi:hypothetical protein
MARRLMVVCVLAVAALRLGACTSQLDVSSPNCHWVHSNGQTVPYTSNQPIRLVC